MNVTVDYIVADEGSIVVFEGVVEETAMRVSFAADHRPARDIIDAIDAGEDPVCWVEEWQIIGTHES